MFSDYKEWLQAQIDEIESVAVDLAEGGRYHYFEDFIDRLINTTQASNLFFDKNHIKEHFASIYKNHYNSRGGI